ncbi:TonB-dependent receptor [Sphingomonas sp. HF-S3]|uniref:TonB-dependent receptor n=1 Tax=Sphingomonas rustica TaxID=3103142 RepID=A0ABV0B7Z6_9SPHN
MTSCPSSESALASSSAGSPRFRPTARSSILALTFALLAATPALAQSSDPAPVATPDAADDNEIVVTALKTGEQQLDRVPLAIQAFSEESLKGRGVRDAADLIQLIPGASQAQEIGAGYRIFSFRGSGAGGPIGDGMIGYYLDDTPFGIPNNQTAPPLQYFDIERVEVLRGPQGTLYGQGSMGGAIIYRTKNPDLEKVTVAGDFELSTTRDAGNLNYRAAGAVSVPLIADVLAIRLSAGYDYRAGYNDIYQGAPTGTPYKTDANDVVAKDFQAVVLFKPTDRATLRLRAWKFSTDQDYLNVMNSVDPPYAAYQGNVQGYDKRSAEYYSGTFTYEFDGLTLTNATAYQKSLPGGFGVALNLGPPLGIGTLVNGGDASSFVNEFRLSTSGTGPFHWVGGAFYQKAKGLYDFSINFPTLAITGSTITRTENASVFSEISYELFGGKLVPLVGLRYFKDNRSSDSVSSGVPASSEAKPDALTWRANLAYYPSTDWMVFFNAGTGFRSGILQSKAQADAVIADGVPSALSLTPDKLRNLEVGVKGSAGKFHIAASVYDIKYTNLQSAFNTSIGLAAFANLGDAKTRGLDLELGWDTPVKGLTLSAIANFNSSEFTDVVPAFAGANPRVANGQRLLNTPPYNVRFDASFDREFGDIGVFANASATAVGRTRNGDATVNELKPYQLYRASAGVRFDHYELRIFAENLSDERGPTAANGPTLLAGPRPRTIGLGLRVNY